MNNSVVNFIHVHMVTLEYGSLSDRNRSKNVSLASVNTILHYNVTEIMNKFGFYKL